MIREIEHRNEYIRFTIESESRNGLVHEVLYNTNTGQWSCECEDCTYRKRLCKHIKQAYSTLLEMGYDSLEIAEELYIGEKVTFQELPIEDEEAEAIPSTSTGVEIVIDDLSNIAVLMELLNIKEQVLSLKENNTDNIDEINNILESVNRLLTSHS